jgi:hypothetical protein
LDLTLSSVSNPLAQNPPGHHFLFGIVSFDEDIICFRQALGHRESIAIAGVMGFNEFPSLPNWSDSSEAPLLCTTG